MATRYFVTNTSTILRLPEVLAFTAGKSLRLVYSKVATSNFVQFANLSTDSNNNQIITNKDLGVTIRYPDGAGGNASQQVAFDSAYGGNSSFNEMIFTALTDNEIQVTMNGVVQGTVTTTETLQLDRMAGSAGNLYYYEIEIATNGVTDHLYRLTESSGVTAVAEVGSDATFEFEEPVRSEFSTVEDGTGGYNWTDGTLTIADNGQTDGLGAVPPVTTKPLPTIPEIGVNVEANAVNKAPVTGLPATADALLSGITIYSDGSTNFDITQFRDDSSPSYFIDYVNGSDSNDGLTLATAFKTMAHASTQSARNVYTFVGGQRHYNAYWFAIERPITIKTTDGSKAILIAGNEDDSANFVDQGNGVYLWTNAPDFRSIVDETIPNPYGQFDHIYPQSSAADVQTNGGYYYDGTDLYVKLDDGRAVDSSVRFLDGAATRRTRLGNTGVTTYIENIAFWGFNLYTGFNATSNQYLYRCELAYNAFDPAFSAENGANGFSRSYLVECLGHSAYDGDIFSSSAANEVYHQDCVFCYADSLSGSRNASTSHVNALSVGVNSLYVDSWGRVVDDTSSEKGSIYINCKAYKTLQELAHNGALDNTFKFEHNVGVDSSIGIFINCTDTDGLAGSGSAEAQANCDLQNCTFRDFREVAGVTVDYNAEYYDPAPTATVSDSTTGDVVSLTANNVGDPVGKAVALAWNLTTPSGSSATLSSASGESTSFTMDESGEYIYQVTVTNSSGDSSVYSSSVTKSVVIPTENRGTYTDIHQFLLTQGYGGSLNDVLNKWLETEGLSGTFNDKMTEYLRNQGYEGSLPDMRHSWIEV